MSTFELTSRVYKDIELYENITLIDISNLFIKMK